MDVIGRPVNGTPESELFEPVGTNLRRHDKLILDVMTRTANRDFGRALLLCPPGTAKTTNASVIWPSHRMGQFPGTRIALGSYGAELAQTMGRRTRAMVRQPRYRSIFNTGLSRDSGRMDHFVLENGSEYMADSISGSFPGHRFEGAIADDPVKGISQAQSETKRVTTWEEFRSNFMTRIVPTGWLVIIMTRWDEEDPAGHILPETWNGDSGFFIGRHDGYEWEVLCLQAKCETRTDPLGRQPGEYLAPEWFPAKHWQQYENDPRNWNSLFQQRPRPLEGSFFHGDDMLIAQVDKAGLPVLDDYLRPLYLPMPTLPHKVNFVFAIIDSAVKTGIAHDGLAVMFFARSILNPANPPLVVLGWELLQMQGAFLDQWLPTVFERLEEYAQRCGAFYGSRGVWIEDKVSGTILLQQAAQNQDWMDRDLIHAIDTALTAMGKKERAVAASKYVSAGMVKWTEEAWTHVVTFKGATKNHALSQVLRIALDSKDNTPDDALDTFTYGTVLSLGNYEGF